MRLPGRSTRILLLLAVTFSLFLLAHRFRLLAPIERLSRLMARPVQSSLAQVAQALGRGLSGPGSLKELRLENERLRQELAQLLVETERQRLNQADAEQVREARRLLGERQWTGTLARVIGRSPDPTFRLYLVNQGRRSGVLPGSAVIVRQGLFVGKVLEAEAETAKILLGTDPHASVAGLVENTPPTQGLLTGEHGLSFKFDLVGKGEPLAVGQVVVTAGLEPLVPRGLVVGRVASVENLPGELFQTASVLPAADFRDLTVVTILTNA